MDLDPAGKVKIKMQFRERSSGEKRKVLNIIKGFLEATLSYEKGGGIFVDRQ